MSHQSDCSIFFDYSACLSLSVSSFSVYVWRARVHRKVIITVRNEVAKVMFLHLSVILSTGGVCLSACWDTTPSRDQAHPSGTGTPQSNPQEQAPPKTRQIPPDQAHPPRTRHPPGRRRLLLRTVRILLECILVFKLVAKQTVISLKQVIQRLQEG